MISMLRGLVQWPWHCMHEMFDRLTSYQETIHKTEAFTMLKKNDFMKTEEDTIWELEA